MLRTSRGLIELFVNKKQRKRRIQIQLYLVAFYYALGYVSTFIRSHHQAYIKYAQKECLQTKQEFFFLT